MIDSVLVKIRVHSGEMSVFRSDVARSLSLPRGNDSHHWDDGRTGRIGGLSLQRSGHSVLKVAREVLDAFWLEMVHEPERKRLGCRDCKQPVPVGHTIPGEDCFDDLEHHEGPDAATTVPWVHDEGTELDAPLSVSCVTPRCQQLAPVGRIGLPPRNLKVLGLLER